MPAAPAGRRGGSGAGGGSAGARPAGGAGPRAGPSGDGPARPPVPPGSGPWAPLAATLALQTLATMAAYSMPAAAPEVGRGLGVEPALVGVFISVVYGVGMVSALLSPSAIRRFGAARTGQLVLLATAGMLCAAASGSLALVAASAVVLGLGYGATAPVATHLIVPRTRPGQLNLILSIRQIGVPLGGALAGLLVPPMVLAFGWRTALLVQAAPALALLLVMQAPRARWDDVPVVSEGAGRLARAIAASLFFEDRDHHRRCLEDYAEPELLGNEWPRLDTRSP